jgi:hypothetical protein
MLPNLAQGSRAKARPVQQPTALQRTAQQQRQRRVLLLGLPMAPVELVELVEPVEPVALQDRKDLKRPMVLRMREMHQGLMEPLALPVLTALTDLELSVVLAMPTELAVLAMQVDLMAPAMLQWGVRVRMPRQLQARPGRRWTVALRPVQRILMALMPLLLH